MKILHITLFACAVSILGFMACGTEREVVQEPAPQGPEPTPPPLPPGPGTPPPVDKFAAIKPNVDRYCTTCHNGRTHPAVFRDGATFKRARARIASGNMPIGGALPAPVKKAFLDYIDGK